MRISALTMAGRMLPQRVFVRVQPALTRVDAVFDPSNTETAAQRKAVYTFAIRLLGAVVAYLFQIILARSLGGHEFGIFVVVWTWVTLLSSLVAFGFDTAVIRLLPEYDQAGKQNAVRGVLLASRAVSLISSTALVILGITGVWLFGDIITNHYVMPLYLGLVCLPLLSLMNVQDGIAKAYDWFDLALIPTYIFRPVAILALLLGVGVVAQGQTAEWALTAAIGGTYLIALLQYIALRVRLGPKLTRGQKTIELRNWLSISMPILLIDGFFILLTSSDILVLGYFVPPEQVAIYHVAVKTLAIAHFVYFALKAVSGHRFSRFYHSGDQAGLADYAGRVAQWCFWPTVLLCGVLLAAGPFLLMLFGSQFSAGYGLMFVLVVGVIARASVGPAASLLAMSGHQGTCAWVYGATFALNLGLNILFIWQFGLIGAAVATSLSLIFETVLIYAAVRRKLGLHVFVFAIGPQPAQSATDS